jgi:hypothetical protein
MDRYTNRVPRVPRGPLTIRRSDGLEKLNRRRRNRRVGFVGDLVAIKVLNFSKGFTDGQPYSYEPSQTGVPAAFPVIRSLASGNAEANPKPMTNQIKDRLHVLILDHRGDVSAPATALSSRHNAQSPPGDLVVC